MAILASVMASAAPAFGAEDTETAVEATAKVAGDRDFSASCDLATEPASSQGTVSLDLTVEVVDDTEVVASG